VGVGFEGVSGHALATYAEGATTVRYRTWEGAGWSAELSAPDSGGNPNSMVLYPRPGSDQVMLAVQDAGNDLNYILWSGTAWGTPREEDTNTAKVTLQPFTFLWGVAAAAP
jgi:hypothetical protein